MGELGCSHESLHVGVGLPGHKRGGCEGFSIDAVPALTQEGWNVHARGYRVVGDREHERGGCAFLASQSAGEQVVLSAVVVRFLEQGLQEGDRVASSQQSVEEQLAKEDESLTAATMGGVAAELSRHQSAFGCDGVEGGEREIEVQVQCLLVEREIENTREWNLGPW